MKNSVYLVAAVVAVVLLSVGVPARANLLTNGNLDDPGTHETDVATGWTLTEGPFIPGTPPVIPDFNPNAATFASFANHTPLVPTQRKSVCGLEHLRAQPREIKSFRI